MRVLISTLIVMFCAVNALAGDKINNGGGLWGCMTGPVLNHATLVDLYEARTEFGLKPIAAASTDVMVLVNERALFLNSQLPDLGQQLTPYLSEVLQKLRYVEAELKPVDDSLYRLSPLPPSCANGVWQYVQFANFTEFSSGLSQVLVRKDLWESPVVPALDKSALIWHEAIYRWMRVAYKDSNSVRARLIVGIIYSQQSPSSMKQQIDLVLSQQPTPPSPPPKEPLPQKQWVCLIKNPHISKHYSNYAATERDARFKTLKTCREGEEGFFCAEHDIHCDSFEGFQDTWTCQQRNLHNMGMFSKTGRSKLEAEARVRAECEAAPDSFHCEHWVNCTQ